MCSGDIAVLSPHGNHLLDCKCNHCVAKYSNVPVHGPDERDCRISMALRVGWSLCLRDTVDGFSPTGYLLSSGGQKLRSRCQIEYVLERFSFLAYRQMSSCYILMWLWYCMHLLSYSEYYIINGYADKHCQGNENWVPEKSLDKINLTNTNPL